jgi:Rrf2 family transcriptional regulator, cysteine metabolism repressor
MFTISTKGDYGMLFMAELVKQYKKGFVSLSDFSKRKKVSSNYLHQVVIPLKKKGLVTSREGIKGGYSLSKTPNKISILSVIEALEGPLAVVHCMTGKKSRKNCPGLNKCEVGPIWDHIQREMISTLQKKTLQDIFTPRSHKLYSIKR